MSIDKKRMVSLDLLRGVASIQVAMFHFGQARGGFAPLGYLSVDLFFMLSGFVLSMRYSFDSFSSARINTFLVNRFVRLYPLFFFGLMLGVFKQCIGIIMQDPRSLSISQIYSSLAANIFMFPAIPPNEFAEIFPLNGALWSLPLELIVSLIFFIFWRGWQNSTIVIIMIGAALPLLYFVQGPPYLNLGWSWSTLSFGLSRSVYSFAFGMLIFRAGIHGWKGGGLILPVVAALLFASEMFVPDVKYRVLFEFFIVLIAHPLILFAACAFSISSNIRNAALIMGKISYPLYCLHWPLIPVFVIIGDRFDLPNSVTCLLYLSVMIVASFFLDKLYDTPLRNLLNRKFGLVKKI